MHPALDELGLHNAAPELNQAAKSDASSIAVEPVLITTAGILLGGFGQWQLALLENTEQVNCIEYPLDEEQALLFILAHHRVRNGWSAFVRIEVALRLEPSFQRDAMANQQFGGKHKGSAKLPNPLQIDVREKIAEAAGVCSRNVSKVKQVLKSAHPRLLEAVRDGAVSISRAAKLSSLSKTDQVNELGEHLWQRQTREIVRKSISSPLRTNTGMDSITVLRGLLRQEERQPGLVEVRMTRTARTIISLGKDLATNFLTNTGSEC